MRLRRLPLLLFVVATGLTATSGPTATAAPVQAGRPCATFTGPAWLDPISPSFHGKKYTVYVHKYVCKRALSYVRKLVTHKVYEVYGNRVGVSGGPRGWKCTASVSKTGLAYSGQCSNQTDPVTGPYFSWAGLKT